MRNALALLALLLCSPLMAQTVSDEDVFRYYGMPNSETFTSFKGAFGAKKGTVYKLSIENEPAPKKLEKLSTLTTLQVLKLSNNFISNLPADIGNLNSLIFFKSEYNPLKTLPASIGGWGSLLYLRLSHTAMDSLPKEVGYLDKLKEWRWNNNKGDTIKLPKEIKFLKALKTMELDSVLLDTLPKELALVSELKELKLSACNITVLPNFWGTYKGKEVGLNKLEALNLSGNNISELPTTLFYCRNLVVLDLSYNKLTKISDDISLLKKLAKLDLRGNAFSAYDIAVLQGLLPECTILY